MSKIPYKVYIRVVKELNSQNIFDKVTIVHEPLIIAESKDEVKKIILSKYPQFFQNNKVYEKNTKDKAQFFYLVIFPLYNWELKQIKEGSWVCAECGQVHENKYISKPREDTRLTGDNIMFCRSDEDICIKEYLKKKYKNIEFSDDLAYIKTDSLNYIYKCTEKTSNKSYIGKTRNAPFFRWWNHLKHSQSPFGVYLRESKLSDWTFEVIEELPANTPDEKVFEIETKYINKYNSIENGFNSVVSSTKTHLTNGQD